MKNISLIILATLALLTASCTRYRSSFTLTYAPAAIKGVSSNFSGGVLNTCLGLLQSEDYWLNYFALEMMVDVATARNMRESFYAKSFGISKSGDVVTCVVKTSFGRDDATELRSLCISFEKYLNDLLTSYHNNALIWLRAKAFDFQANLDKLLSEEPEDNAKKNDWLRAVSNNQETIQNLTKRIAKEEEKPPRPFKVTMP